MNQLTKPDFEILQAAVRSADTADPDPAALAELRRVLATYSNAWKVAGDMARQAEAHLLTDGPKMTPAMRESIGVGLETLRRELAGDNQSGVERLIIEQVALCWLRYYLDDYCHTTIVHGTGCSVEESAYWDQRLERSQRRYLRALESLARVRRLTISIDITLRRASQRRAAQAAGLLSQLAE